MARASACKRRSPKDRVNLSSVYEWRSYPDDKDSNGNALILDECGPMPLIPA
jgi:hypothetical protein